MTFIEPFKELNKDKEIEKYGVFEFGSNEFQSLCTDSREEIKNRWFLAIEGEKFDGHKFVNEAISKGAIGVIVNKTFKVDANHPTVKVDDTLSFLQKLAHHQLAKIPQRKISLTGSAGKTTVKNMLASVLQHEGETVATPGSFNNEIGIPKTAQLVRVKDKYGVFEQAARHKRDIKLLTKIVNPNIAMCLNVGRAHLGEFGSEEVLFRTKMEIYDFASDDAVFVLNSDDPRIVKHLKDKKQKKVTFGHGPECNVQIETMNGPTVHLLVNKKKHEVTFNYPHATHAMNAAATIAVCLALGISIEKACSNLGDFQNDRGRFSIVELAKNTILIDDAYNANPESFRLGLDSMQSAYPSQEKILILGDMLEMGPESPNIHRSLAEDISRIQNVSRLLTVGDHSRGFKQEQSTNHQHFKNTDDLLEMLNHLDKAEFHNKVVFIKSSFGIGLHRLSNFFKSWLK